MLSINIMLQPLFMALLTFHLSLVYCADNQEMHHKNLFLERKQALVLLFCKYAK